MGPRILNMDTLLSTGNYVGRKAVLEILEAGLQASDPYNNTFKLIRREGDKLIVGNRDFEPAGTPLSGDEVFDLSKIGRIFVFGAGKGIQRIAKALEDLLGDRLEGGHVIDKKGHPIILKRIGVTLGSHPAPDADCVLGCQRILEMTRDLTENDLVFTLAGNGISSLLTMPAPGLTIDEVSNVTRVMQIERGVPTPDLNPVRTHLDAMKGGKISRHIRPAKMVHLMGIEARSYHHYMTGNSFIHTLPDYSTFRTAIDNLKRWDAWDAVSPNVRRHLETADPAQETVKQAEFETWGSRIYGLMPGRALPAAMKKAEELGFKSVLLADQMSNIEASQVGLVLAQIALTIEQKGQPFEPPVALFTDGELVVTVGQSNGVGGRHQEMTLTAAQRIDGSENIVIGSVDADGTDGPGTQYTDGTLDIPCLAGGVVDGTTMDSARRLGINVVEHLKRHDTTPPMWKLSSGIIATPNIRVGDIIVALVTGRK